MSIKNLNNTAFSLLEVLMASLIFVISIGGIFATLNPIRTLVINKEGALTAAVFGKRVLETLRSQVSELASAHYYTCSVGGPTCPDFALSVGTHQVPHTNLPAGLTWPSSLAAKNTACDSPNGCLVYTVSCGDGNNNHCGNNTDIAHRVDLNINY